MFPRFVCINQFWKGKYITTLFIWLSIHYQECARCVFISESKFIILYQENLVPRPMGEVTLICKSDSVHINDVREVRWYIHDTMTLLYTFAVSKSNIGSPDNPISMNDSGINSLSSKLSSAKSHRCKHYHYDIQ